MRVRCLGPCGQSYSSISAHLSHAKECQKAYYGKGSPCVPSDQELSTTSVHSHNEHLVQYTVFQDLYEMYWFRYFTESSVQFVRDSGKRWVDAALDDVEVDIERLGVNPDAALAVSAMLRKRLDIFKGLETESQVRLYATRHLPVMDPMHFKVGPGPEDTASGIKIIDWLVNLMRFSPLARSHIMAASESLKSGSLSTPTRHYADMHDGSVVQNHAFAQGHTDIPGKPRVIFVFFILGFDEMEPLNALGAKRGNRKVGGFYGALPALPAALRYEHEFMSILMVVEEKVLKKCNPIRVVAGADPHTGAFIPGDYQTIGAQCRELFDGVLVEVFIFTSHLPHICCTHYLRAGSHAVNE